jgi:putative phosphoribosyl transferase
MYFNDRLDAAEQLVPHLKGYKNRDCIVLAIPRGGVPMGCHIAKALNFPFDLLMTKKIGHPHNPEYAIGAVSLEGRLIDENSGIHSEYIEFETIRLRKLMQERYKKLMGNQKPLSVKGKILIIVDDGIATGYTLLAAIELLRKKEPNKIVVAVPVAPIDSALRVKKQVDDFICLYTPFSFYNISSFYNDFSEVSDEMAGQSIHGIMLKNRY